MARLLNVVFGVSIGLILGFIVGYVITSGNIVILESENDALSVENEDLESRYSELLSDYDYLKNQEIRFSRENKMLTDRSPGRLRIINMTAEQYKYTPDLITVDLGDIVVLRIWSTLNRESGFGEHGFALNDWYINERLPEDTWTTIIFVADNPGEHYYWCSRDCGKDHPDMLGRIIIEAP